MATVPLYDVRDVVLPHAEQQWQEAVPVPVVVSRFGFCTNNAKQIVIQGRHETGVPKNSQLCKYSSKY